MSVLHYLREGENEADIVAAYGGQAVEYRRVGEPFMEADARKFRTVVVSARAITEAELDGLARNAPLSDAASVALVEQIKALNPFVFVVGYAASEEDAYWAEKALPQIKDGDVGCDVMVAGKSQNEERAAIAAELVSKVERSLGMLRVLYFDDQEALLSSARDELRDAGLAHVVGRQVTSEAHVQEYLPLAAQADLLMTDGHMKQTNVSGVLRHLGASEQKGIPVVVYSADENLAMEAFGEHEEVRAVIRKAKRGDLVTAFAELKESIPSRSF